MYFKMTQEDCTRDFLVIVIPGENHNLNVKSKTGQIILTPLHDLKKVF